MGGNGWDERFVSSLRRVQAGGMRTPDGVKAQQGAAGCALVAAGDFNVAVHDADIWNAEDLRIGTQVSVFQRRKGKTERLPTA